MAANVIRDLLVRLGVDADTKGLKDFSSGLSDIASEFAKVAAVAAGAVAAIGAVTVGFAEQGDAVAKTSRQLGITGEAFQELTFAASRASVAAEPFRIGLFALARNAEAFTRGTGEAKNALDKLGVTVGDITRGDGSLKTVDELLTIIADRFQTLESGGDRVALAQRIFGESGGALIPLLEEGAVGLEELRRQARDLGLVIDSDALAASERFSDSLTNLQGSLTGLRNAIGAELIVALQSLVDGATDFAVSLKPTVAAITQLIDRTIGLDNLVIGLTAVAVAAGAIATALAGAAALFGTIGTIAGAISAISAAVPIITAAATAVAGAVSFIVGLISSISAIGALGPVLGVVAAAVTTVVAAVSALVSGLVSVALAIEDFFTFVTGGQSALEQLLLKLGATDATVEQVREAFQALGPLISAVVDVGLALAELLGGALFVAFKLAINTIADLVSAVLDVVAVFLGLFGLDVGGFFENVTRGISGIATAFEFLADIIRAASDGFDAFAAAIGGGGLLTAGFDVLGAVVAQVTGLVDSLVASLSAAGDIASTVSASIGSVGGLLGGAVSNVSQAVNLSVTAPITTTASAGETAEAVSSSAFDTGALFSSFFGSEQ